MPDVTADLIERYLEADRTRKQLASEADQAKKICDLYKTEILEWLEKKCTSSCKRYGYVLSVVDGPRYPKWKDAFMEQLGKEAATAVFNATEPSKQLVIVKK